MAGWPEGVGVVDIASVAAGVVASGEAVGVCANELIEGPREQIQTIINLFIVDSVTVGCVQRCIWIQLFLRQPRRFKSARLQIPKCGAGAWLAVFVSGIATANRDNERLSEKRFTF